MLPYMAKTKLFLFDVQKYIYLTIILRKEFDFDLDFHFYSTVKTVNFSREQISLKSLEKKKELITWNFSQVNQFGPMYLLSYVRDLSPALDLLAPSLNILMVGQDIMWTWEDFVKNGPTLISIQ